MLPRLTEEIMSKIEGILKNKPSGPVCLFSSCVNAFELILWQINHGRPALDVYGRL